MPILKASILRVCLYLELLKIVVLAFSTLGDLVGHIYIYNMFLFYYCPNPSLWYRPGRMFVDTARNLGRRHAKTMKWAEDVPALQWFSWVFHVFLLMLLCGLVVHQVSIFSSQEIM